MRRTGRVLIGVIALALLVPEATLAGPRDRGPLKPGVVALGFSPVQILTSYNRWVIGTPAAQNPMLGNRCEPSPLSQRIWFAPPSSDPIICTVPKGAYLVISVVWFECSNLEPPPFYGNDEASLRLCLDAFSAGELLLAPYFLSTTYQITAG